MSFNVPQESRFQMIARVNDAIIAAQPERDIIFRETRKRMVEQFAGYVTDKCIRSTGSYMGFSGSTLRLDVYVLAPRDLHAMLDEAYNAGLRSKDRFSVYDNPYTKDL